VQRTAVTIALAAEAIAAARMLMAPEATEPPARTTPSLGALRWRPRAQ